MKTITKANDIIFLDKVTKAENHRTQQYDFLSGGLTKREYFAAMAMQGLMSDPRFNGDIPKSSVKMADLLIEELNKEVKS